MASEKILWDQPKKPLVWWQDEADVWEGLWEGDRRRWIGRFNLQEVKATIRNNRLLTPSAGGS